MMTVSGWVSLEMQGDFDVVSGLGSLAPRLLFSAVEDSCQLAFSRLLQPGSAGRPRGSTGPANVDTSFTVLTVALKVVVVLGLTIVVFAQAYSWPLLVLYAGWERAGAGAGLLRVFAFYVLILAVNGVTECFYYSAIGKVRLSGLLSAMRALGRRQLADGPLRCRYLSPVPDRIWTAPAACDTIR